MQTSSEIRNTGLQALQAAGDVTRSVPSTTRAYFYGVRPGNAARIPYQRQLYCYGDQHAGALRTKHAVLSGPVVIGS